MAVFSNLMLLSKAKPFFGSCKRGNHRNVSQKECKMTLIPQKTAPRPTRATRDEPSLSANLNRILVSAKLSKISSRSSTPQKPKGKHPQSWRVSNYQTHPSRKRERNGSSQIVFGVRELLASMTSSRWLHSATNRSKNSLPPPSAPLLPHRSISACMVPLRLKVLRHRMMSAR